MGAVVTSTDLDQESSTRRGEFEEPSGASWPVDEIDSSAQVLGAAADRFSDELLTAARADPVHAGLLGLFNDDDLARLKAKHAQYLRELVDPESAADMLAAHAEHGGAVHAMCGVQPSEYATAMDQFRQMAVDSLDVHLPLAAHDNGQRTIHDRIFADLRLHLRGYQEVAASISKVTAGGGAVAGQASTLADLVRGVLDALVQIPGVVFAYFGRPDSDGIFQFESIATATSGSPAPGRLPEGLPLAVDSSTAAWRAGPTGRAWLSGEITRSDSYLDDASTEPWHDVGRRFGFRSNVAIPLTDSNGLPHGLIAIFATRPGMFADQAHMLAAEQVRRFTEQALVRLESQQLFAGATTALADRSQHLEKLARGEVVMLYQPIVDLRAGAVVKFEALARLSGDDRLISPAEFLPSFGGTELWRLFEIGLDQALTSVRAWEAAGTLAGVSINLPTNLAITGRHSEVVVEALRRHSVSAERLTLEVLESGQIETDDTSYRTMLITLREFGVRIAEDDLGTAYSSLLRLRYVTFDEAKIARELICWPGSNASETWGIVQPLTTLIHQLGPSVTVEGLETQGLIEAMAYLGADFGQGYGIARPMPADAVPGWVADFRWTVDQSQPSTDLGALATHLMWERRLRTQHPGPVPKGLRFDDPCLLHAYLVAAPTSRAEIADAHDALHLAAIEDPHGTAHHVGWARLTALLGDTGA